MATTYREGGIVEVDPEPVVLPGDRLKDEAAPAASAAADAPDTPAQPVSKPAKAKGTPRKKKA